MDKIKRVKTSIMINPKLLDKVRYMAYTGKSKISHVIENAVKEYINSKIK